MKVLYEASSIGLGYGHDSAMAGVFRVICEILRHAESTPGLEVGVCADTNPVADYWGRLALRELNVLPPEHWVGAWGHLIPATIIERYERRYRQKKLARPPFSYRVLRKLATLSSWRRADAREWDVFHSLAYPLDQGSSFRVRARCLMIYDMIPIHSPQFFGDGADMMRAQHLSLVNSIRPQQDWVTAISECSKKDFCEFARMAPERVFVTPLAAGPEFHPVTNPAVIGAVRAKYKLPAGRYLLSLCTLEPRKNLPHLVRCFVRFLEETRADVHLVLAGAQGWKFDTILQTIEGVGRLRERIVCPGRIANEDLAALYSGALAFVYPSLYEGFGLPPLEAMQCGLPVISSNNSSLPEVVGDAGLTVAATDTDALCDALRRVVDDAGLRADLAARGLARAKLFSWEKTMDSLIAAYRATQTGA
jgi:glycosyltransferase involved in cell wall biosynthesis